MKVASEVRNKKFVVAEEDSNVAVVDFGKKAEKQAADMALIGEPKKLVSTASILEKVKGTIADKSVRTVNILKDKKTERWATEHLFAKSGPVFRDGESCFKGIPLDGKDFSLFEYFTEYFDELDTWHVKKELPLNELMAFVERNPKYSLEFFVKGEFQVVLRYSPDYIGDYIEEKFLAPGEVFDVWENLFKSTRPSAEHVEDLIKDTRLQSIYTTILELGVSFDDVVKTALERGYNLKTFKFFREEFAEGGCRAEKVADFTSFEKKMFCDMTNDEKVAYVAGLCDLENMYAPGIMPLQDGWVLEYKDRSNKDQFHVFCSEKVDYTKEDWLTMQATVAEVKAFCEDTGLFVWREYTPAMKHKIKTVDIQFSDKLVNEIIPSMLQEGRIFKVCSKSGHGLYMKAVMEFFRGESQLDFGYVEKFITLKRFYEVATKHGYHLEPYHKEPYDKENSIGYVVVKKGTKLLPSAGKRKPLFKRLLKK